MLVVSSPGEPPKPLPPGTPAVPNISLGAQPWPTAFRHTSSGHWLDVSLLSDARLLETEFLDISIFVLMTQANNQ